MVKSWLGFIALSVLFLVGCGGGDGSGGLISNTSLDGVWEGTFVEEGVTYDLQGLIYENRLYAFSGEGDTLLEGRLYSKGSLLSGTIEIYEIDGWFLDQVSVSGSVNERQKIKGKTSSGSTFDLTYSKTFDRSSSLALVAGIWSSTLGYDTTTITIQNDGTLDGSDSDGCYYSGKVSTPNTSKNIYRLNLTISNCGELNGPVAGYATLSDFSAINDSLIFGFSNEQMISIGMLLRQS